MYPNLFGIDNFSYTLCMFVGIILAFVFEIVYLKKKRISKEGVIDLIICGCFAIAVGVIFAILFENLYELIEKGSEYVWTWAMTFYGGLFGGVLGFLAVYFIMRKNCNFDIKVILKSAPIAIALAHSIGRIGCFLAGCCYGKETDSWIGLPCAHPKPGINVIPTQLIEAIFLLILFGVMLFLLLKFNFKYNLVVYTFGYSIFRFIIEFFRDDPRGVAFALSPSQIFCIVLFVLGIPLIFLLKKINTKKYEEK